MTSLPKADESGDLRRHPGVHAGLRRLAVLRPAVPDQLAVVRPATVKGEDVHRGHQALRGEHEPGRFSGHCADLPVAPAVLSSGPSCSASQLALDRVGAATVIRGASAHTCHMTRHTCHMSNRCSHTTSHCSHTSTSTDPSEVS